MLKELLEDGTRALIVGRADEERVCELGDDADRREAARRRPPADGRPLRPARRALPRPEVEELVLEEVPDITYADVGGLDDQIEQIQDAVELPYLLRRPLPRARPAAAEGHPAVRPARVAARRSSPRRSRTRSPSASRRRPATTTTRSYFLNIKGPELLNKYVGETERQIRLIFQRAREKSEEGVPVIVFFDEMDSLFRTRGTGISLRHREHDRAAAARRDRRRRER